MSEGYCVGLLRHWKGRGLFNAKASMIVEKYAVAILLLNINFTVFLVFLDTILSCVLPFYLESFHLSCLVRFMASLLPSYLVFYHPPLCLSLPWIFACVPPNSYLLPFFFLPLCPLLHPTLCLSLPATLHPSFLISHLVLASSLVSFLYLFSNIHFKLSYVV